MDDPGGGGGASSAFGSRYEVLNHVTSDHTIKKSKMKQTKRSATRDNFIGFDYNKQPKLDGNDNGGRFLILTRTDGDQSMKNVSPFLIKKTMDNITPNVQISRLRNGSLLLKTVDHQQAEKLKRQTKLGDHISINVVDHETLNTSRGTITCHDLVRLSDDEILEGLKEQRVIAVRRITRRCRNGEVEDTGTFILTFNLSYLPPSIDAGFYRCRVRLYLPPPLRCFSCFKFGHKKENCRGNRICAECAELFHDNNPCKQPKKCVCCRGDHNAWSKECPVYVDEVEIQRIKITERVSAREARQKRRLQVPVTVFNTTKPNYSFANVVAADEQTSATISTTDKHQQAQPKSATELPEKQTDRIPKQQSGTEGKLTEPTRTKMNRKANAEENDHINPTVANQMSTQNTTNNDNNNRISVENNINNTSNSSLQYRDSSLQRLSEAVKISIFSDQSNELVDIDET